MSWPLAEELWVGYWSLVRNAKNYSFFPQHGNSRDHHDIISADGNLGKTTISSLLLPNSLNFTSTPSSLQKQGGSFFCNMNNFSVPRFDAVFAAWVGSSLAAGAQNFWFSRPRERTKWQQPKSEAKHRKEQQRIFVAPLHSPHQEKFCGTCALLALLRQMGPNRDQYQGNYSKQ